MAKLCQINRNKKREKLVARYAAKRAALKAKAEDMKVSMQWAMASMPVAAVRSGGKLKVSKGSSIATLGIKFQE